MTSAVGRKTGSKTRMVNRAMAHAARRAGNVQAVASRGRRGFTILELMLALAMLVLLVSLAVVGLNTLRTRTSLNEGVSRFETVLRMARNEAVARGQRLQLAFDASSGEVTLLVEPDPLGAPGQFELFAGCTWLHQLPNELVTVRQSVLDALVDSSAGIDDDEAVLEAITFYPDGSADSARVELASRRQSDARRALIELDGLSGRIQSRIVGQDRAIADDSPLEREAGTRTGSPSTADR